MHESGSNEMHETISSPNWKPNRKPNSEQANQT